VSFIILAKDSGYKSEEGVSHKSLDKIIFFIVSNLLLTSFLLSLLISILILSSLKFVLYLLNLYLDKRVVSIRSLKFLSLFDTIVKLKGRENNSSHKNSISVLFLLLLKNKIYKFSILFFHKKKFIALFSHILITSFILSLIFFSKLSSDILDKSDNFSIKKTIFVFLILFKFVLSSTIFYML